MKGTLKSRNKSNMTQQWWLSGVMEISCWWKCLARQYQTLVEMPSRQTWIIIIMRCHFDVSKMISNQLSNKHVILMLGLSSFWHQYDHGCCHPLLMAYHTHKCPRLAMPPKITSLLLWPTDGDERWVYLLEKLIKNV